MIIPYRQVDVYAVNASFDIHVMNITRHTVN